MSYEGYFDRIIELWYAKEKCTPTLKRDMKEVLNQFETSVKCGEIPEERIKDLTEKFSKIRKEVYD